MPELYARQEQDPEKHLKEGVVETRPLGDNEGGLRPVVADAFALKEGEDGVDMKDMGWIKAGLVATCEAIALGTLSFPSTFHRLGLVGGFLANLLFVILAYPYVMNVADCGGVMFGKWGARVFGVFILAKSIGLASSHVLAGKIAVASFDDTGICTVAWAVVIAAVSCIMSLPRKWSGLVPMSVASLTCIVVACIITMVAASKQDPASLIKNNQPIAWKSFNYDVTLSEAVGGITNCIFAYGGNMAVFSFLPEMREPRKFTRSILIMQSTQLIIYSIVGGVVYSYGGQYVTSPALSMIPRTPRIVAYAFALVTIIVSGVVAVNVGAKYAFVAIFRDTPILTSKGFKAKASWTLILVGMWVVGFVLAELIPFFNQLLTIVSALCSTWFVCGLGGICYLHLINPRLPENANNGGWLASPGRIVMIVVSLILIAISCVITPLGLYSAIKGIIDGYSNGTFHHPFTCAA
ncbi:hypothetical protein JCM8547_002887 [Rhodosporidiobolus lusitaniae]